MRGHEVTLETTDKVLNDLRKTLRWLVTATVVLYIAIGAIALNGYVQANNSRNALCTLREDAEARLDNSRRLLMEHPRGFLGFSVHEIQQTVLNQERTVLALSNLGC